MRLSHLIIYFALAAATADYGTFQAFKLKFGKSYDAPLAESRAQECWKENMEMIRRYQSNSSTSSLELGENIYSDQCWEDFSSARLMPKPYGLQGTCWKSPITEYTKTCNLSQAIDWRKEGAVTPVKNQASCGSCWSFSATGCMEGAWFRKTGKLASFSEQELVSCDTSGDDHGCKGGGPDTAFQWAINNGGIATEEDYPYTGKDDACDSGKESKKVGQFGSFQCLDRHNETLVLAALQNEGPMSIVVQATQLAPGGIQTMSMSKWKGAFYFFLGLCFIVLVIAHIAVSQVLPEAIVAIDTTCSKQIDMWVQKKINKAHADHIRNWKPRSKQGMDFLIRSGIRGACFIHALRSYVLTPRSNHGTRPYVIVGAHHKTGSTLARKVFARLCAHMALECGVHTSGSQFEHIANDSAFYNRDLSVHSNWRRWLPQNVSSTPNFRFVHFVREPCGIIASGYKYHRRKPETWTYEFPSKIKQSCGFSTGKEYCMNGRNIAHFQNCKIFEEAMLENSGGRTTYPEALRNIFCNVSSTLEMMGLDPDKINYADALNALPTEQGLALEAAASYFTIENMLYVARKTVNDSRTYTLHFEDLMSDFDDTIGDVIDFLDMPDSLLQSLSVYNVNGNNRGIYGLHLTMIQRGHNTRDHKREELVTQCRNAVQIRMLHPSYKWE